MVFWDRRDGCKQAALSFPDSGDITALHYLGELTLAVGTERGTVSLLDLRSPRPHFTRDHQNGFAIRGITSQNNQILSWDKKALKIWDSTTPKAVSIEPSHDINDVVVQSGFIALAVEDTRIASYLFPPWDLLPPGHRILNTSLRKWRRQGTLLHPLMTTTSLWIKQSWPSLDWSIWWVANYYVLTCMVTLCTSNFMNKQRP